MTEVQGRVIVLGHGQGHGHLVTINCGAHHDLMKPTAEITAGHLDGTRNQGGVAGITIESLRALSLSFLVVFSARLNLTRHRTDAITT